jgi:hypothetical protein
MSCLTFKDLVERENPSPEKKILDKEKQLDQ